MLNHRSDNKKNRNLYLTQLYFGKSNSQPKVENNSRNRKEKDENNTYFISKNKGFNSCKESMLDYMIQEETQFVDLEKCEEFYKTLNFKKLKQINEISSQNSRKKKYLNEIQKQIEKVK